MRRFLLLLLGLLIGLLIAVLWPNPYPRPFCPSCGPLPRQITVGVTGGVTLPITVIPDVVTAYRGDTLSWVHPAADSFFINLVDRSLGFPTADSLVGGSRSDTATTTVRLDAQPGTYKYSVTVWSGGQPETMDPRVVVKGEEGQR